jgi:hypothetical protein
MVKRSKAKRSFTIEEAKDNKGCPTKFALKGYTGRYMSSSASGAASKAATQLCRTKRIKGTCVLYIDMRETTQNSKHKIYKYRLTRKKLKEKGPFGNEFKMVPKSLSKLNRADVPKCASGKQKSRGRRASRKIKFN